MQEKIFNVKNYWRNIDKQILVSFSILFILGVFFSFSSTSFLADERLNKSYYFFFQKHLIYACASFLIMIIVSTLNTDLINRSLIPIFIFFVLFINPDPDGFIITTFAFRSIFSERVWQCHKMFWKSWLSWRLFRLKKYYPIFCIYK